MRGSTAAMRASAASISSSGLTCRRFRRSTTAEAESRISESSAMTDDSLIRLSASAVVDLLKRRQVSPLELIDAALARIAAVEPRINAMVTLCPERARDQARRLMKEGRAATDERPWLGGLPIAVKDLNDVAGVRTTYGSPIFADNVPA